MHIYIDSRGLLEGGGGLKGGGGKTAAQCGRIRALLRADCGAQGVVCGARGGGLRLQGVYSRTESFLQRLQLAAPLMPVAYRLHQALQLGISPGPTLQQHGTLARQCRREDGVGKRREATGHVPGLPRGPAAHLAQQVQSLFAIGQAARPKFALVWVFVAPARLCFVSAPLSVVQVKRLCPRAVCPPHTSPLEISSGVAARVEVVAEALLVKVVQDAVEESRRRVRALGHAVSRAAAVLRILRHPRRGCRRICERHPRRGCWPVVHRRACGRGAGK